MTTLTSPDYPNILILMVDEMRYPPGYESTDLAAWRTTNLPTQEALRANGCEFQRHYAASMACGPSRTTLWTGQYPSLHGVTQTPGAAKSADEEDMYWLDPNGVPTLGDYFRTAGYRTYWKGKWHISNAAIMVPGTHEPLASYDNKGIRNYTVEEIYDNAGRLEEYGFSGWVGPDPHGSDPLNSGSSAGSNSNHSSGNFGRDVVYADQVIELIQQLNDDTSETKDQSWLTVASFVNPHDIALWSFVKGGPGAATGQFDFTIDDTVPTQLFDSTFGTGSQRDTLSTKPSCQKSYLDSYGQIFMPVPNPPPPAYFQYYYQLQKNVDVQLGRVCDALKASRFSDNTIVVLTSDHGDLLGSHGGMMQKWYQTYDEALHVPFIISNVSNQPPPPPQTQTIPTSHADFVPTMLGLAGLAAQTLQQELSQSHTESWPLAGRNLAPLILGQATPDSFEQASDSGAIFFMSDDDPSRGDHQQNFIGLAYNSVIQPNHIECVIVNSPDSNGDVALWKYTRYFDNTDFWTDPVTPTDVVTTPVTIPPSPTTAPPPNVPAVSSTQAVPYTQTTKTTPVADEFEMYNLTVDQMELQNLAGNPAYAATETLLKQYLNAQRFWKRLTPVSAAVPFYYWPQIASFSPTPPLANQEFSGQINGAYYEIPGFISVPTGEQGFTSAKFIGASGSIAGQTVPLDVTVTNDSTLSYRSGPLSAGTWQLYVQTSAGWAASEAFTVAGSAASKAA